MPAVLLLLLLALLPEPLAALDALPWVQLHDDGQAHGDDLPPPDPSRVYRAWPFCPTDRIPCTENELAWAEVAVSIDAYSLRRNDPHASIRHVVDATTTDLQPLATALARHFETAGVTSQASRVAFVHGLVQGITYSYDTTTGWTEYPKFGIEFLVDEQGDCDDAAITLAALLQDLGFEAWFVSWVSPSGGHLSTAVSRRPGDLASFQPPAGSDWISGPDGTRLLHVDGTGNPDGCGRAWVDCGPLGFNQWAERGLRQEPGIRASDPQLEEVMPISAWNHGGLDRPERTFVDRRTDSDQAIRDELRGGLSAEERARLRMRRLTADGGGFLFKRARIRPLTFYIFVGACLSLLLVLSGYAWRARLRRLRRAAERRAERQHREF